MINKNKICQAISLKLVQSGIIGEIAYENSGYVPPQGTNMYALITVIPAIDKPLSNCTELSLFGVDIDIYVEGGKGAYYLRETIAQIGELFNPLSPENAHWLIDDQLLSILTPREVQGAKTDDGWYYSTCRLELKVMKDFI